MQIKQLEAKEGAKKAQSEILQIYVKSLPSASCTKKQSCLLRAVLDLPPKLTATGIYCHEATKKKYWSSSKLLRSKSVAVMGVKIMKDKTDCGDKKSH